ncbi:uncharacterized protein LOC134824590 [Bolinopsis microptera]|uniref:uncharacterized protein LOC134824590 n=1 Tax=Bolinopsis microptera TaxID=2820187 RepID=UPI003079386B
MCAVKSKHHLIPRATIDIFLHGWKVKLDDGQYAKTWITDQSSFDKITPAYVPERFDILGEKLDKAFLDITGTLNPAQLTSYFNDITIGRDAWDYNSTVVEDYNFPSESSLELPPLFYPDEAGIPPPPPPPPPLSVAITKMESIGDQLENSQYSPTHTVQYDQEDTDIDNADTRYSPSRPTRDKAYSPTCHTPYYQDSGLRVSHNNSPSSSDYLSADDDFPPPAPSPPSIPNTPSDDDEDTDRSPPLDTTLRPTLREPSDSLLSTSSRFQRTPDKRQSSRTPTGLQCTPSKRSSCRVDVGDDYLPLPMDLEDDLPSKTCPEIDGEEFDELQAEVEVGDGDVLEQVVEKEGREAELELGHDDMIGNYVEDIDSPDELEEEDPLDADRDPSLPPSQLSLFHEIITDSGDVKRVLYFRKSKFRMSGTALHHLSKMSSKMDYKDACKNTGLPEVFNKTARPFYQGRTLSNRIEKPKNKLPLMSAPRGQFTVPLVNLTRSFKVQQDPSIAPNMRRFGVPLRQIRGPLLGLQHQRSDNVSRITTNLRSHKTNFTRSEQLISEYCACWVQRPFHDTRCATMHDNFVETILKRHGVQYGVVKECIKEYSARIGESVNDPVRSFNMFKSIIKSKT